MSEPPQDSSGTRGSPEPRLRVEAVVSGRMVASSRFRVLQHVEPLGRLGIDVTVQAPRVSKYRSLSPSMRRRRLLVPAARAALKVAKVGARVPAVASSWRGQLTWLERELLPGALSLEPLLHRPLLFDVDDAIWLLTPGHDHAVRAIARRAACVIAGNDFLADWFSSVAPVVERVHTAIDTERFHPATPPDVFTVGWTGSASTLRYLEDIAEPLRRFFAEAPEARLVVLADLRPRLPGFPSDRLEVVRWRPEVEADVVRRFSVGLMPLPDTDWGRGKCAFKMLQYLASGVPAVVSPVGMGAEVLAMGDVGVAATNEDAWVEALLDLRSQPDRATALGRQGRAVVERAFAVPAVASQLAATMRRHV